MRTLKHPNLFTGAIVLGLVVVGVVSGTSIRHGQIRELYSGVWASHNLKALPLPVSGYQAYIVGEMHGVKENEEILLQYLTLLHEESRLRDVAIEEDAVYQADAAAYVEGKSSGVPEALCLRAGILLAIRQFNEGRDNDESVRVHLVDIDTPAAAIRQHLMTIKERVGGSDKVYVPDVTGIKEHGLETVKNLKRVTSDRQITSELRTVEHSIRAYQQGLEVGRKGFKGSPYLDSREEAISANIQDLLRERDAVLVLYGSDHVSKATRNDGGPNRDSPFSPLALRLEQAGVKVFSIVTFPLSGRWRWRGYEGEMLWTAGEGKLASGETLDQVVAAAPEATLFYVDPKRQQMTLPSQDVTAFIVDAFLLFADATAMEDQCGTSAAFR